MKEKVIARIVKGGWNKEAAIIMVYRYFDMAVRHGNKTVNEIADAITWYAAV